jgi:hypothetical protein
MSRARQQRLNEGDRVVIVGSHPHCGAIGHLKALEELFGGPGWFGWRVEREDDLQEFYAESNNIRKVPAR